METITTIEDLAARIQRTMASKEDLQHLERKMDDGFFAVNRRIDLLHEDISDLPDIRDELTDLGVRMDRREQKVGLVK